MVISIPSEVAQHVPTDVYFTVHLTARGIEYRPLGRVPWIK